MRPTLLALALAALPAVTRAAPPGVPTQTFLTLPGTNDLTAKSPIAAGNAVSAGSAIAAGNEVSASSAGNTLSGEGAVPAAATKAPAAVPPPPPPPAKPDADRLPRFGLRLDAGVPDGGVLAFVWRPSKLLRLDVGPTFNYIGWGYQVGIGLTPIRWYISPTLNFDYGHYFESDASTKAKGVPDRFKPSLQKVGYDYLNGQLGLEFGSPRGLVFSLRLGLSYFWTTVHADRVAVTDPGSDPTVTVTDPKLRFTFPSLKLGLLYYF